MKPFDDLTHDELVALDDAAISFYIDKACAEEGVPLLPPSAPVPPIVATIDKRVTHYIVSGLRFTSEADARAVQEAIAKATSRRTLVYMGSYRWQDPQHDAPAEDEVVVTLERVFDADGAAAEKAEKDRTSARKAEFDAAKKEYDAALSGRDNVAAQIRGTVNEAHRLQHKRDRLMAEYERYIPLANGDAQVAKRFLQRAHSDARDVLPRLFPDGWNDEPVKVDAVVADTIPF